MKRKRSPKNRPNDEKPLKPIAAIASPEANQQEDPEDVVVVAIGASAGGLEAFSERLSHLPPDTGMAFVLVQHLDPKHESMLTELISSRSTRMPVLEVKHGMSIKPDHVYVIPPNTTMTIQDHTLHLSRETVQNLSLHRLNHVFSDNPELQKVLHKAQQTSDAIAPFTVELRMDGETRRKFECRLEPITLEGGAKVITLSLHASFGQGRSAQTGG